VVIDDALMKMCIRDRLSWHDRITRTYLAPRTRVTRSNPSD